MSHLPGSSMLVDGTLVKIHNRTQSVWRQTQHSTCLHLIIAYLEFDVRKCCSRDFVFVLIGLIPKYWSTRTKGDMSVSCFFNHLKKCTGSNKSSLTHWVVNTAKYQTHNFCLRFYFSTQMWIHLRYTRSKQNQLSLVRSSVSFMAVAQFRGYFKTPPHVAFLAAEPQRVTPGHLWNPLWSSFSSADVMRTDSLGRINGGLTTRHCFKWYWSKFTLILLIKAKNNTEQSHDLKERLDKRLGGRFWSQSSPLML